MKREEYQRIEKENMEIFYRYRRAIMGGFVIYGLVNLAFFALNIRWLPKICKDPFCQGFIEWVLGWSIGTYICLFIQKKWRKRVKNERSE